MGAIKIKQGVAILTMLGMPREQQNERSALTLLAVLNLGRGKRWAEAEQRMIRVHDILAFVKREYRKTYAENTRETIRRQTLHQFEQAGIVYRNPDDPSRPTNSPNNVYMATPEAVESIKRFETPQWQAAVADFARKKGRLFERYAKRRRENLITVKVPGGTFISLSPGQHNELQVRSVEEFRLRFCPGTEVLYVGDTARKMLFVKEEALKRLGVPITQHDKLPDVVLYDQKKHHLILLEAVTAHGPMSPKRQVELEKTLKDCKAQRIYVSAFPDLREFKRHIDNIAWETEVWIADHPDHMIHFIESCINNGTSQSPHGRSDASMHARRSPCEWRSLWVARRSLPRRCARCRGALLARAASAWFQICSAGLSSCA